MLQIHPEQHSASSTILIKTIAFIECGVKLRSFRSGIQRASPHVATARETSVNNWLIN